MTIVRQLVSPAHLTDAQRRIWLGGRDAFLAAGGSAIAPSAVVLNESGSVLEVILYRENAVDRLARVPVGVGGKFQPIEWISAPEG